MDDNFDKLRRALLGTDIDRLNYLQAQLNDRETFKSKVAENLTAATTESHITSNKYSYALKDPVIDAIGHGSLSQPAQLAKSLGPVMLPAIAEAVARAMAELKQVMDETLTSSFTLKGLKWRREAARTGLPYGTIALRHTLKFQAEHVFLASKRTGAIISDVLPNGAVVGYVDPESAHGKYRNAVKQLALSAVITKYPEDVQTMPAGESNIHVAHSAWATLALVTWGEASIHVKAAVQATLDAIEHEFAYEIKHFSGDASVFEVANIRMKALFDKNLNQAAQEKKPVVAKPFKWKRWLSLALLALIVGMTYLYFEGREKAALERTLAAEPAFLLGKIDGRLGLWRVNGLADPAGFDAAKVLKKAGLNAGTATFQTKPFLSLDTSVVLARAQNKLLPPANITLSINPKTPNTLTMTGNGDATLQKWADSATSNALTIPGIDAVDTSNLVAQPAPVSAALPSYGAAINELQDMTFSFSSGAVLKKEAAVAIDAAAKLIIQISATSFARQDDVHFACQGHIDGTGSGATNDKLKRERADALCEALAIRGVPQNLLKQEASTTTLNARIATVQVSIKPAEKK
jgi:outer membrane protein OmpA-like peptidoglycan-associated protein